MAPNRIACPKSRSGPLHVLVGDAPMRQAKSNRRAKKTSVEAQASGWGVRVGKLWIERFTYAPSTTKPAKSHKDFRLWEAWEKSEGIRIAQCLKAVLGSEPFLWPFTSKESAEYIAGKIAGAVVGAP